MTAPGFDERRAVVEHQDDAPRAESRRSMRRAALICYHNPPSGPLRGEWTYWDSREQARQDEAELTPCGLQCVGVHSVVRLDSPPEPRRRASRGRPVTAGTGRIQAGEVEP